MALLPELTGKTGFRPQAWPLFIAGLSVLLMSAVFAFGVVSSAFALALFLAPFWLPILIIGAAWPLWMEWRRSEFIAKQDYILLEIKPPRSIEKTPLAMEAVIDGLHLDPGESNWYKVYIEGSVRPAWSLEIASIGGQVHFFVWARRSFRRQVESQIYAQYPGAAVVEAPDYTRMISGKPGEWDMFGCDYRHTQPDPYPIKTYVDYGLDKVQKEPEQTDPLANLIEFLGSMGANEQFWVQLIIRVHKGEKYHIPGHTWRQQAEGLIQEIRAKTVKTVRYRDVFTGEMRETEGFPNPTKGQAEAMAAIERNVGKQAFDVGIRALYLARPGHFNGSTIANMKALFKQFSSASYNGITWAGGRGLLKYEDYPWEVNVNTLKAKDRADLLDAYRRRQYFWPPYDWEDYMVMSTEELATLYHIPSRAVEAPALARIPSATGEAPPNLPT